MKNISIAVTLLFFTMASCQPNEDPKTLGYDNLLDNEAAWLLGKWENQTESGKSIEFWRKINDSLYRSESYIIENNDTISYEQIDLIKKNNALEFIPTVKGQNHDSAIVFKQIQGNKNQLIFEDPSHDFPQKISYTQYGSDSLYAEISGNLNGKPNAIGFPYKKVVGK